MKFFTYYLDEIEIDKKNKFIIYQGSHGSKNAEDS